MIPLITTGVVVAHAPNARGLNVALRISAGSPSLPVRMLYDVCDALRISQRPLPEIGSWGVLCFPGGDHRNGFWLGAYEPSAMSAITSTGSATDPYIDYESHWSGFWRQLDGKGKETTVFPDGTSIVIGPDVSVPVPNRFTVENNQRTQIPFTQSERVPNPPSAFTIQIKTASGVTLTISAAGQVSIDMPAGEKFDLTQAGASPSDALTLVSKMVSVFNAHTHKNVASGAVNSGPPTTSISATDIESVVVGISG